MSSIAEQYRGFALAEREQNLYSDSYFHLTVWNADECRVEEFVYAATAYPSAPMHPSTVQALLAATGDGVKAAAARWREQQARRAAVELIAGQIEAGGALKGDKVRVVRGRKVPRGVEGVVLSVRTEVVHTSRYGTWQTREVFAFIDGPRGAWKVAAKHLEVIERGPAAQELFDLAC